MNKTFLTKWGSEAYIKSNFLNEDELVQAKKFLDSINVESVEKVMTNHKFSENNLYSSSFKKFCHEIEKKYEKQMQIILRELVPHKASIPTRAFCTLSVLPPNCSYEVHEDKLEKVLSGVIYLGKENIGTLIHNSKKDENPDEINWEENKIFVFSRQHNISWHSYKSNENKRYTMILNLVTDNKFLHLKTELNFLKAFYWFFIKNTMKYLRKLKNKILKK